MSHQEKGSTLVMQPTSTGTTKTSLFRRKSNWTQKPKKTFLSLLMCCTLKKKDVPITEKKKPVQSNPVKQQQHQQQQHQQLNEKVPPPAFVIDPSHLENDMNEKQTHNEDEEEEEDENERSDVKETQESQVDQDELDDLEEEETIDDRDSNVTCLLDPLEKEYRSRKCLVLDLDETLIHSSFKTVAGADFIVPVEIEGHYHNVFVLKRPGVDDFMKRMGELYEIVIFTASLSKYADPVLDIFDLHKVINHRLFRESCHPYKGAYIKDLSRLGRDLKHVIILDNTPASYSFHPSNAVPVSTWFNDQHDSELIDLIPFLEDLAQVDDVVEVLDISLSAH